MEKFFTGLVTVIGVLVISFLIDMLLAWPFMLLWNWLMPMIFGLKTLTFWQSFGVMLLSSFLFKDANTNKSNN